MNGCQHFQRLCFRLLLVLLLSACAGSPAGVSQTAAQDRQWLNSMQAGRDAFDQGHYQLAERLFARALERGRQMDRASQIADAAFNLAAAQIQLGDFAAAHSALQEAKGENARQGATTSEILLLEARVARLQADRQQSRAVLEQLQRQLPESEFDLRSQALLLSGLLACEAGDLALAMQEQALAVGLLASDSDRYPLAAASRTELQGCIKLLQQQPLAAAGAFDRQSELLQQAQQYRQMVTALHRGGLAYAAAGDNQQAAERLFRAARSAFSQKRPREAHMLLEKAASAARAAEANLLLENIGRLRSDLSNAFPE